MPNLVASIDPNFFPLIDIVVQSESIQYNRVGSKDLNFADINGTVLAIDFNWGIL